MIYFVITAVTVSLFYQIFRPARFYRSFFVSYFLIAVQCLVQRGSPELSTLGAAINLTLVFLFYAVAMLMLVWWKKPRLTKLYWQKTNNRLTQICLGGGMSLLLDWWQYAELSTNLLHFWLLSLILLFSYSTVGVLVFYKQIRTVQP